MTTSHADQKGPFMPRLDVASIEMAARLEIAAEDRRGLVEAAKLRIREAMKRKRWWHSIFPYTISFNMERLPDV